jgi:RND superfamily putative drug exporter
MADMNSVQNTAGSGSRSGSAASAGLRTGLFDGLGIWVARHRWPVLIAYLVAMVLFGVFGVQVFGAMKSEGFNYPGSDSSRAAAVLAEDFGVTDPAAILAIETPTDVDTDAAAATAVLDEVAAVDGVDSVVSYWSTGGAPAFLGTDGRTGQAIVIAEDGTDREALAAEIVAQVGGEQGEVVVYAFGGEIIGNAFNDTITGDLARAESIAIPITALILLFVFGSVVAAGLPFLVAGGTILGSFLVLFLVSRVTDVSVFALNLVTGLGLALGIDYALLIINRFREELAAGRSVPEAVAATVGSAGRTVFVSGLTVAVALASLLIFPQYFLRSFAYAGIAVSLLAVIGALTAIPALLAILGRNVNRLKVRRGDLAPKDDGAWARIARFVMRRPWPVLIGTVAALLVLAAPALGAVFGQVDERALPPDNAAAQAGEVLRERFPGNEGSPYEIVVLQPGSPAAVQEYAEEISRIPEIDRVTTAESVIVDGVVVAPNPDPSSWSSSEATRIEAVGNVRPIDPAGEALVAELRAIETPGEESLVGGLAAEWADATNAVLDRIWIVALWLAITTMIILFLFTGSVLIPIKALVLNLLSLAATLGALVWVFQNGHLQWLTGEYTVTGTVDISTIALIAVIAFALSMDYEVFMLARIKEEHDAGASTSDAVAFGLQRTGRIITAAALLIAIVFASFLTSSATNIKQLGFGVTVAILLDATVVRALLVPAFMRIAGNANWWAPAPLRRLHARLGLRES